MVIPSAPSMRLNFPNSRMISTTVTKMANASDAGNADHTPLRPKQGGNSSNSGIKKIIWRVRLRKIDFAAIPSDWKKLVDTIWNPTPQNINMATDSPLEVTFINAPSVVNAMAM